jgi:uncharacterized membrane protein YgcG
MVSSQAKMLLASLLLVVVVVVVAAGSSAAFVASNILLHDTVEVTNTTDTVYADVTNTTNGSVNVTFYGGNASTGNYTLESEQQVETPSNTTRVDWVVDSSKFDSYKIFVHEDASDNETESIESAPKFGSTELGGGGGGGGLFGGGESSQTTLLVIGVVVVGYVLIGRD